MATVSMCDRCQTVGGQVVPVLGVDCCNACIEELRGFLASSPLRSYGNPRTGRIERIMRTAKARGSVNAQELAVSFGEQYRTTYYSLIALCRNGRLVHKGKGVFVLPIAEAAE